MLLYGPVIWLVNRKLNGIAPDGFGVKNACEVKIPML